MTRSIRSRQGFTIVELVVTLAIIGILSVIAMKTFGSIKEKGKLKQVEIYISEMENALSKYAQKHGGNYPGLKQYRPVNNAITDPVLMGPAITGGNGGPVNEPNTVNQDDFLYDMKGNPSPFRSLEGQPSYPQKMQPIDELVFENIFQYPDNPYREDGTGVINIAYIEYSFNPLSKDYIWTEDIFGLGWDGLAIGFPADGGVHQAMAPWNPADPTTYNNYPIGEFAYIPLSFTDFDGKKADGYWLIGYGDLDTLVNSPYNKLLDDPDWPYFQAPFDDDDGTLPPVTYEAAVRQLMTGALVVKANIYMDQLKGFY